MKKYFLLACAFCAFGVADAATIQFSSPDKKLQVTVADDGGRPTYRVVCGETVFLEQSPLGLLTNIGDFSQGMTLQESSFSSSPVSGHYELPTIKRSKVDVRATKAVCPFYKDGKHIFDVVFHVSDHDVAFKYKMYPQGNTLCCVVKEETTASCFLRVPRHSSVRRPGRWEDLREPARVTRHRTPQTVRWERTVGVTVTRFPACSVRGIRAGC